MSMPKASIDGLCKRKRMSDICGSDQIMPWSVKFMIAIVIDILDFGLGVGGWFVGPGVSPEGTIFDAIAGVIAVLIFGAIGSLQFIEVLIPTDIGNTLDGFIPTVTIAGILSFLSWKSKQMQGSLK